MIRKNDKWMVIRIRDGRVSWHDEYRTRKRAAEVANQLILSAVYLEEDVDMAKYHPIDLDDPDSCVASEDYEDSKAQIFFVPAGKHDIRKAFWYNFYTKDGLVQDVTVHTSKEKAAAAANMILAEKTGKNGSHVGINPKSKASSIGRTPDGTHYCFVTR